MRIDVAYLFEILLERDRHPKLTGPEARLLGVSNIGAREVAKTRRKLRNSLVFLLDTVSA
jgi:hypothetical protein